MIQDTDARRVAVEYLDVLGRTLRDLDLDAVLRVCGHIQRVRDVGGMVYLAGNGGSAATASHWANDLGKATKRTDAKPIRVMSLGDQLSWLTALANDEGYARVFAGQLENFAHAGDLLAVFSASGNSPNLVEAVRVARSRGVMTVGFLGFDGGTLKSLVDDYVWLPTPIGAYGAAEDGHLVVCHLMTTILARGAASSERAGVTVASESGSVRS